MKIIQKQDKIIENQSCGKQKIFLYQNLLFFHVTVKSYKYTEKILET